MSDQRNLLQRAFSASPLGATALVAGFVLGIVFFVRFNGMLDDVDDDNLYAAIRALEVTVVSLWFAVSLWGWYLLKDGLERVNTTKRLNEQAELLSKIHEAVEEREAEKAKKEELSRKARNFFNRRRSGDD